MDELRGINLALNHRSKQVEMQHKEFLSGERGNEELRVEMSLGTLIVVPYIQDDGSNRVLIELQSKDCDKYVVGTIVERLGRDGDIELISRILSENNVVEVRHNMKVKIAQRDREILEDIQLRVRKILHNIGLTAGEREVITFLMTQESVIERGRNDGVDIVSKEMAAKYIQHLLTESEK